MINTFDIDKNFWLTHSDMKVINPFKGLYDLDMSNKKEHSSQILWFIVFCYDRESKFYRLDPDEKHIIVGEDLCGDSKFYANNKLLIDSAIQMYVNLQYSPMEKHMFATEKLLHKRAQYLDEVEYNLDNGEKLDKIVTGTFKVWQDYKKTLEEMQKEDASGMAKGGATPSLLD